MAYLFALITLLAVIFSTATGHNPLASILAALKNNVIETVVPPSEQETLINHLQHNYGILERYASENSSAASKNPPAVQEVLQAIQESNDDLAKLKTLEHTEQTKTTQLIKNIILRSPAVTTKDQPERPTPSCSPTP